MTDEAPKESVAVAEIRSLRAEDGEKGLWTVYSQLTDAPKLPYERFKALVIELEADPHRELVVAVNSDESVIGTASLVLERKLIHGGALCGHIEDVVVSQTARGRGLGKKLVEHVSEIARQRGCYKVILDCSETNVKFYERCGFTRKGVEMAQYFDQ